MSQLLVQLLQPTRIAWQRQVYAMQVHAFAVVAQARVLPPPTAESRREQASGALVAIAALCGEAAALTLLSTASRWTDRERRGRA